LSEGKKDSQKRAQNHYFGMQVMTAKTVTLL